MIFRVKCLNCPLAGRACVCCWLLFIVAILELKRCWGSASLLKIHMLLSAKRISKWTFVLVFCDLENDITTVTSVFLWVYGHVHKWHLIVLQCKLLEAWHDFIGGTLDLHQSKFTGKCPLIPLVWNFMLFCLVVIQKGFNVGCRN